MGRKRAKRAGPPPSRPEPKVLRLPGGWLVPVLVGALVLLGLALRASDLRADPPPDLSWSFAPYADEGLNTYSARNMVLYGAWKVDDFFPFVVYPLVNFLVALVFKVLGVGFVQVKLVSVLAGVASILALYLLVKDAAGRLAGLLAAAGVATCYPLVMYSRLGLVESLQILFLLLAGLYCGRGLARPRLMILSGLFAAGTVLLVKISAVFVAPVMVALFFWQFIESSKNPGRVGLLGRTLGWWFVGAAGAALVWFFLVFLPHRADYLEYVLRHSFESPAGHPSGLVPYLANTLTVGAKSRLIPRLGHVAFIGFLFMPGLAFGRRPVLRFLFAWFAFGTLMLGYMNYRPPRYETILLPVLVAFFAAALGRFIEQGMLLPRVRLNPLKGLLFCFWTWALVVQVTFHTQGFWGAFIPGTEAQFLALTFGIGFALTGAGYLLLRALRADVVVRSVPVRLAAAGILILLVLRLDLVQYSGWFSNRTHDLVSYSQELDRLLPAGAVLGGNWAPTLLLESRKRALGITDWANHDDPVGRFGMTHLVSHEQNDIKLLERSYPDLRQHLSQIWSRPVRGTTLTVYALTRP